MDKMDKNEKEKIPTYIGRKKCGCIVAAVVNDGLRPKEVGKAVAEFITSGLTIEQVTVGYVRTHWHKCTHNQEG